ncbi:YpdA family putative bacillithiol disulfide reductase [Paenibacillus validus]|uniref:YpdA family putative bacillithiol disulfide reductase n=1 Tax=Paenibacillus TaxID=44249 RepID=UPI000FDAC3B2|nr:MULTISPECIES: YpdA family putative bacillithiol disulfide reductase [Paenibacillus]MED4600782.1 YpdA family putative bacillithiol disulfide reductase [Paenibacillus validus]MED4608323.1 YpdA family putative bacillithiol disulfide reductase [Paenibacillus validus]
MEEAVVIGAGPCGLSAAIELQKIGIDPLVIEKENVVHSIYLYPTYMQFFSTPELLEIGDYPFSTPNEKPTRQEALTYYRTVASRRQLRVRPYQRVTEIGTAGDGAYKLTVADASGRVNIVEARHVIVATGYFDQPNLLGIPGEQLPKVSHYFREAHPYAGTKVTVIGGSNSAVDAAMELLRAGAEVTVVYRGDTYSPVIKPWVRPIFESMVNKERIRMWFGSRVTRIDEASVTVVKDGQEHTIENDFVLALTGFHPDRSLLRAVGAAFRDDDEVPLFDPETMETTCPGIYIAGVAASGRNANEVFIETGRNHGVWIARHIASKR